MISHSDHTTELLWLPSTSICSERQRHCLQGQFFYLSTLTEDTVKSTKSANNVKESPDRYEKYISTQALPNIC